MRKWIAIVLLICLTLCGCTTNQAGETTAPDMQAETTVPPETTAPAATTNTSHQNVELTVLVTEDFLWQDQAALDAMLEEFNAYYPNIFLKLERGTVEEIADMQPDLVLGSAGQIGQLYQQGMTADLSDIWAGLEEDVYSAAEAVCGDENGYHTVPLCMVVSCVAINRQKLEDAQAMSLLNAANHTWSNNNFLQACGNLYDWGLENACTIYCMDTDGDEAIRLLVTNFQGGSFVNTVNGSYTPTANGIYNALDALKGGYGIKFMSDVNAGMALEQFLNGETAIALNWNSALQVQYGLEDENIFYMLYPSSGKTHTYADTYGLAVMNQTDVTQLAASMTLAGYISTSDAAVRATGQLPARKSAVNAYADTEEEEFMTDLMKLLNHTVVGEIPGKCWEDARAAWVAMLQEISRGTNVKYCTQVCQVNLDTIVKNAEE